MNKLKVFLENFLVYGFGGIISKIIPLLMVPIITRLIPDTSYFGISDMSNTIISFFSAIAMMGMYDAMYRIFFEKDDRGFKKIVCSTTLLFTLISSVIVFVFMCQIRDRIALLFFGNKEYSYIVLISAVAMLVSSANSILSAPTRMENRRKIFLITNTAAAFFSYLISIPLLLRGYYIIALPIASVVSGIIMGIIFVSLNHSWFNVKLFDKVLLKQLLYLAIPVMPSFLIYWIFNSCDKIMIANILGIGEAGIYAVSTKLGHASHLIYSAFAGGWQYFAFSTMKDKEQVNNNSKIFEYLGVVSYSFTMITCAICYEIFTILFPEQYISGYIAAPYLFLAPLLQMLYQVISSQFFIIKKTWPSMLILCGGAGMNIVINAMLIPAIGMEGAAIATLSGYILAVAVCVYVLLKMELITISGKFLLSSLIMLFYLILWRICFSRSIYMGLFVSGVIIGLYVFLYRDDICKLLKILERKSK